MFEDQTYSTHSFNFYRLLTKGVGLGFIALSIAWYLSWIMGLVYLNTFSLQIYFTAWVTAYSIAGIYLFKLDRLAYQFFFFTFFITVVMAIVLIPYFIYSGINGRWMVVRLTIGGWLVCLSVQFVVAKLISRLVIYGVIK